MINKICIFIAIVVSTVCYSQSASKVNNAQNVPVSVANPPFFLGADPAPDGIIRKYIVGDIRFGTNQITGLDTFIQTTGNSLWQPLLGYVPVTNMRTLTINGVTYDLSVNRTWNIAFNSLIDRPTSLSGYGITDAYPLVGNPSGFLTTLPEIKWVDVTGKPVIYSFTGLSTQYTKGDGTYATFPTSVSSFTNDSGYVTGSSLTTTLLNYSTTAALTTGLGTKEGVIAAGSTGQYWRGDKTFVTLNTSVVPESGNLYYTDTRARASNSAGVGINYNATTGVITNSAPDQAVSLTGSGGINITGTYPNFIISYPAVKRQEPYSGVSNASGVYTITYTTPFAVTPNVQFQVIGGTARTVIMITSSSTTGCSFLVQTRNDVLGLLPTYSNVVGANIDILVTEK